MNISIIIHLLIYLNIISFILGFILAHYVGEKSTTTNTGFFAKNNIQNSSTTNSSAKIQIEESKYVTSIDTSNIEKKFSSLGDVKKTDENISNSVNKLKNLKG